MSVCSESVLRFDWDATRFISKDLSSFSFIKFCVRLVEICSKLDEKRCCKTEATNKNLIDSKKSNVIEVIKKIDGNQNQEE